MTDYFTEDGCMIDWETDPDPEPEEDDEVKTELVDTKDGLVNAQDDLDPLISANPSHSDVKDVVDIVDVKSFPSREEQRDHWYRSTMSDFTLRDAYPLPTMNRKPLAFPRIKVISKVLGGNIQMTFTRGRDGRDMIFATLPQTPYLPRAPGEHGLFFTFSWRAPGGDKNIVRLFVRDPHEAEWLYMGEYKNKEMRMLTREEWNLQSEPFKALRVESVLKRKYAKKMIARVGERKKVKAEGADGDSKPTGKKSELTVTSDDIRAALDAGHEHMHIVALQCVGYDAAVQKRLHDYSLGQGLAPVPSKKARARPAKRKRAIQSSQSEREASDNALNESRVSSTEPVQTRSRRQPGRTARRRMVYKEDSDSN